MKDIYLENVQRDLDGDLGRVVEVVRRSRSFVLTTHENSDGDGLGAEAALAAALAQLGKRVHVVNNDPVPARYRFLPGSDAFQVYRPDEHHELLHTADVLIILDAALPERTGRLAPALRRSHAETVAIDHHPGGGWAQVEMNDPGRSATAELVYDIIVRLNVKLTPAMAEALYTGLVADTQGFHGSNTTPEAHLVAARLLQAGASIEQVHDALFRSWDLSRLRLMGEFLSSLHASVSSFLVWGIIRQGDLKRYGQTDADVEGFVEQALTVRDAQIAALFLEGPDGTVRVSLRSRGGVEVGSLARTLGGGGHAEAAGARIQGMLDEVVSDVLNKAETLLASSRAV